MFHWARYAPGWRRKPKHSAFYSTTLDVLLRALRTRALVVCGFATNICVLFSANDAYMRDFRIYVPPDCIASESSVCQSQALILMERVLKADISLSTDLKLDELAS